LLRASTFPDGEVMLSPRLLDEDDLPRLTVVATLTFKEHFNPQIGIARFHLQTMTAGAPAVKRIHIIVGRAALHTVMPAEKAFRAAPRELLVQNTEARVIAGPTDTILQIRGVGKFAEGSRQGMLLGTRRFRTIDATIDSAHSFEMHELDAPVAACSSASEFVAISMWRAVGVWPETDSAIEAVRVDRP
jgi:hypothetical protein